MSDPFRAFVLLVILVSCLAEACRHQVPVNPVEGSGSGYVWVQLQSGDYGLATRDEESLKRGLADVCQGKPCAFQHIGRLEVFRVTVP